MGHAANGSVFLATSFFAGVFFCRPLGGVAGEPSFFGILFGGVIFLIFLRGSMLPGLVTGFPTRRLRPRFLHSGKW